MKAISVSIILISILLLAYSGHSYATDLNEIVDSRELAINHCRNAYSNCIERCNNHYTNIRSNNYYSGNCLNMRNSCLTNADEQYDRAIKSYNRNH